MITTIRRQCIFFAITLLSFLTYSHAQELRAFNQNSSRSNNTKAFNQNSARSNYASGLSISLSPVYSTAVNTGSDSLLFRGSGGGFRVGADYFFGKAGISFSSGFSSSSPADATINNFLKKFPIPPDQLTITKGKQQNMYLLLGPSVRVGNTVELYAHAKGGVFINNSGLVSIQQKGAQRAAYRNESTSKSVYPGFLTGLGVQYKSKSDTWSFGIGVDYMNTKSETNNYDVRRGGGIEALKLSRSITDVVTGITVRYNILSTRDQSSGQSTGRRVLPTVNKREITTARDASSGMASGKRLLPTVNKREIAIDEPGVQKTLQNCGPVTQKITNADGTIEEITFSCPDDAANYASQMKMDGGGMPNRISMNVTVPKQTQGATFGEKIIKGNGDDNKRTFAVPHVFEQKGIISGRLTWTTSNTTGIITNKTTRGGSTTLNSQTSSTRQTNQSSFGTLVRLSAREAGSGMATGKRSREKGSGLATGRRQYEPVFIENSGDVCNPCVADAKLSSVKSNPLYNDNGMSGTNPMYEANKRTTGGADDDCDGIGGMDVYLMDIKSEVVISKTKTEACGDFFFANVPEGNYIVKVSGGFVSKKGYDVYLKSKTDLAGDISQSGDGMQLLISSGSNNEGAAQKAGISTSRSNIRTKSISIIEADLDGDGEFESLKATGIFSDGTTRDISNDVSAKKINKIDAFTIKQSVFRMNNSATPSKTAYLSEIKITGDVDGDGKADAAINNSHSNIKNLRATATFSDGSTADVTEALVANTAHSNVRQYSIAVGDLDGDGFAEAVRVTKTRSNIQNNRVTDTDGDGIWSPKSNIKMLNVATGDVNGDGIAETIVGGAIPGGAVISAAMRPGAPIKGISVKGGRNPGGNIGASERTTNEDGEFEFPGLEAGDYTFTVEQRIFIEDETQVTVGNKSKAQDHNSSRSNKTSSLIDNDPDNGEDTYRKGDVKVTASQNTQSLRTIGPDMEPDVYWIKSNGSETNKSVMKAQNNNTVRSNRTDNALIDNFDNNNSNNIAIDESGQSKPRGKANTGQVKWVAPESMKTAINNSHSNIKNLLVSLDDLDKQLNADQNNAKSIVNTSRSNIKSQRAAIGNLEQTIDELQIKEKNAAMDELEQKRNEADLQFLKLRESVNQLGPQYNSISNVLKSRHDMAMSSIRNLK